MLLQFLFPLFQKEYANKDAYFYRSISDRPQWFGLIKFMTHIYMSAVILGQSRAGSDIRKFLAPKIVELLLQVSHSSIWCYIYVPHQHGPNKTICYHYRWLKKRTEPLSKSWPLRSW